MGCFNQVGFISKLTIKYSDPIIVIPCVVNYGGIYSPINYYSTTQLTPISLPIFGDYNDYGSIEDIEGAASSEAWKRCMSDEIEASLSLFTRGDIYSPTLGDVIKGNNDKSEVWFQNFINNLHNAYIDDNTSICLLFEHREVYDKLAKSNTNFREKSLSFFTKMSNFMNKLNEQGLYRFPYFGENVFMPSGLEIAMLVKDDRTKNAVKDLLDYAKTISDEKKCYNKLNAWFGGWQEGFYSYIGGTNIWDIPNIAEAFADFSTFDRHLFNINSGYGVPSGNSATQTDNCKEVIKFNDFLKEFYETTLKDKWGYDEDGYEC